MIAAFYHDVLGSRACELNYDIKALATTSMIVMEWGQVKRPRLEGQSPEGLSE